MKACPNSRVLQSGHVPIIVAAVIESPDLAAPALEAILEGGLTLVEIPFRSSQAALVLKKASGLNLPVALGAGTLTHPDLVRAAADAGAMYGLTPGFNPRVIEAAAEVRLPLLPGVMTPGEVEQAFSMGCEILKIFPASCLGGREYIDALSKPYAHTGVRFVPFGGVSQENIAHYLASSSVVAVGGTWLATREMILAQNWPGITRNCVLAREVTPKGRLT